MRLTFILLCCVVAAGAQTSKIHTEGEVTALAFASSEATLPFWFSTNQFNRIGSGSDYSLNAAITSSFAFSEGHTLSLGASGAYRNGFEEEFQRIDLYVNYRNNWFDITVGARRDPLQLDGLSATNQNFLWSQNARPLPGIKLEAPGWQRLTNGLYLDWSIAHYIMNDERFVEDTWVHSKDLALKWDINERHSIQFKLQHIAQWAGTSPLAGEQPNDIEAFFDVFIASRSNEELPGNALGNHMGTYFVQYELEASQGKFSFYHEHPFEDGSGTRLANFPDGVWGISYAPVNKKLFSRLVYEFITTEDQSGSVTGSGNDRYFSNKLYRTGWAYEQTIIGFPFFFFDKTRVIDIDTTPIINDVVQVHHFAANGYFGRFAWIIKSSISKNSGTLREPFSPSWNNWYNFISLGYDAKEYGLFTLIAGADTSNVADDNFGAGIQYSYKF
jgi:hypothetical protein